MASLVSKASSAVAACARRLRRRLLRARGLLQLQRSGSSSVCLGRQLVLADGGGNDAAAAGTGGHRREEDGQGQVALWRRAILMGQRCEPLDFPGAIHYDSFGRRVQSPRCGSHRKAAGALFCRSSDAVDDAVNRHGSQGSMIRLPGY
ncbi:hypothetical protein BDA96_03G231000 [Sorghum bicolor]|uniref:Uncharacterized protein n=2 Tax=Sorghum bicolor TaxID=4558 RepID=A0A921RG88_SORBI|nr:hypothetical protein SORBI_3003G213500 [Sorghum bicolor]KAG0538380.1 hypothetical protein BDA96_03G231000 [Sorghum bicolor]